MEITGAWMLLFIMGMAVALFYLKNFCEWIIRLCFKAQRKLEDWMIKLEEIEKDFDKKIKEEQKKLEKYKEEKKKEK